MNNKKQKYDINNEVACRSNSGNIMDFSGDAFHHEHTKARRKNSYSSANFGSQDVDLDENRDNDIDSISTLESKSLESIEKINDDAKKEAADIEKEISNLMDEEELRIPSSIELTPTVAPISPTISKKYICSKRKMRPSPKILLICLCSISVLSITLYLLIYFSVPQGLFGTVDLYNSYYSVNQKQNRPAPLTVNYLKDVSMPRNMKHDLPFLWHIPYTVDTNIRDIFGLCYNLSQASGYKEIVYLPDTPLHIVKVGGFNYVNIDLDSEAGIDRANEVGLADSNLADVVISPHLYLMANTFTEDHQGRTFVLLRHPVELLLDKHFDSLIKQDEPLTQATPQNFTTLSSENNWLTRQLSNEQLATSLSSQHLEDAKNTLRHKFLIGKVDDIHESFQRFKMYFGWQTTESYNACEEPFLNMFIPTKTSQNYEKQLNEQELKLIYDSNSLDVQLYNYAEYLFQQQGAQLFGVNKFQ